MIQELTLSAIYDLLKGGAEALVQESPLKKAIQQTCSAFSGVENLNQTLESFAREQQVVSKIEELKNGKRPIAVDGLVEILLDKTSFYFGTETAQKAKEILVCFFRALNDELLRSGDGHVLQARLAERFHEEQKAEHKGTQESVRQLSEQFEALRSQLSSTVINTAVENSTLKVISEANKKRVDSAKKLLESGMAATAKILYSEIIEDLSSQANPDAHLMFRAHNNLGSCELQLGNYEAAATSFIKASSYAPDDVKGVSNTALAFLFRGQPAEALGYAERAIQLDSEVEYPRSIKARILAKLKRYEEAIALLIEPMGKDSHYVLGSIYLDLGDFEKAVNHARTLLKLSDVNDRESKGFLAQCLLMKVDKRLKSEGILYFELSTEELQDINEAIGLYQEAIGQLRKTELTRGLLYDLTNLAALYIASGRFEDAIRTSDEALHLEPEDPNALQNKGISALALCRYSVSMEALERLDKIRPHNEEVLVDLAISYIQEGVPEKAIELLGKETSTPKLGVWLSEAFLCNQNFDKALETLNCLDKEYPQNPYVLKQFADYFSRRGEADQYEKYLQQAIFYATGREKKLFELTLADFFYDAQKYRDADNIYIKYQNPNISSPVFRKHLTCLYRQGSFGACLEGIKQFRVSNTPDKFICETEAACNHLLGNLEAARVIYFELSKKNPHEASYMLSQCECLFRMGRIDEAVSLLEVTRNKIKDDPEKLMAVAEAFDYMDKRKEALEAGYEALTKGPNNPELHRAYIGLFLRREQENDQTIDQKYVNKFQESIENFNQKFPNEKGLVAFKSTEDLKEIKEMIRAKSQRGKLIIDIFKENRLPIHCLAKLSDENLFNTWGMLASLGSPKFFVSDGTVEEAKLSSELIEASEEIVLDGFALFSLCRLGILSELPKLFKKVYVAQAVQDDLILTINTLQFSSKKGFMTIGESDGKYFRTEVGPDAIQIKINFLNDVKDFAKTRLAGLTKERSSEEKKLKDSLSGAGLDSMLIARDKRIPLCCDDKSLLSLAYNEYKVVGFSSYHILKRFLEAGLITPEQFLEKVIILLSMNYFYIPVNTELLMLALEKHLYQVDREIELLLDVLAWPETNDVGSIEVSASVIVRIWLSSCLRADRLRILDAILSRLAKKNRGLVQRLRANIRSKFRGTLIALPVQQMEIDQEFDNWIKVRLI